jgi:hypothetical protein
MSLIIAENIAVASDDANPDGDGRAVIAACLAPVR